MSGEKGEAEHAPSPMQQERVAVTTMKAAMRAGAQRQKSKKGRTRGEPDATGARRCDHDEGGHAGWSAATKSKKGRTRSEPDATRASEN